MQPGRLAEEDPTPRHQLRGYPLEDLVLAFDVVKGIEDQRSIEALPAEGEVLHVRDLEASSRTPTPGSFPGKLDVGRDEIDTDWIEARFGKEARRPAGPQPTSRTRAPAVRPVQRIISVTVAHSMNSDDGHPNGLVT